MELLATEALSDRQIAKRLGIKDHTVRRAVSQIMMKLECENRTMVAVRVLREGLVARGGLADPHSTASALLGDASQESVTRARQAVLSLLEELESGVAPSAAPARQVEVLKMVCRALVAACEGLLEHMKSLAVIFAMIMARLRRSTARLGATAEAQITAIVTGPMITAGSFVITVALAGTLFGQSPIAAEAVASRQPIEIERDSYLLHAKSFDDLRSPQHAHVEKGNSGIAARVGVDNDAVDTSAGGRIHKNERRIELTRGLELAAPTYFEHDATFTITCGSEIGVTYVVCSAYDLAARPPGA